MDSNAIAVLQDLKLCTTWRPCPSACSSPELLLEGPLLASAWAAPRFRPLGSRLQPSSARGMLRHTPTLTPLMAVPCAMLYPQSLLCSFGKNAGKNQATVKCQQLPRHSRPFVGLQSSWHDCVAVQQPILSSLIIAYPAYKHDICSRIVSLARTHINKALSPAADFAADAVCHPLSHMI